MIVKQKVNHGDAAIKYSVIKSRRVKTSEIIVEDKVIVRTPFGKPLSEIEKIIREKASWILKKQLECKKETPEIKKATFLEGSMLPYLGKNYCMKIIDNQKNEKKIELVNGQFLISLVNSKHSSKQIKSLYEEWLLEKAQFIFEEKVVQHSKELKVKPEKIIIKNLKDRWGSTTKDNVINLNVNLLKAPSDVIDYMVLHELCHLKIKEHSHRFWDLLHKYIPNYQEKRNWLKENESSLIVKC